MVVGALGAWFAAMHMVPQGIYLIHFLRQFGELSVQGIAAFFVLR